MTTQAMFAEILTRLQEVNAQLHSLVDGSTSSCHPPTSTPFVDVGIEDCEHEVTILVAASSSRAATSSSAPPAPPSTPTSLQEATLPVNMATSEHPPATHTNCSTLGRNTGDLVLASATTPSTSPASSPTSTPPVKTNIVAKLDTSVAATEHLPFEQSMGVHGMVRLSRSMAWIPTMLLGMMESGCAEGGIPIEGAGILPPAAAYCEKHRPCYDPVASAARFRNPFPPFPIGFTPATYAVKPVTQLDPDLHGLKAWHHKFISDLPDNPITSNLVTAALASPTSSPTSAPSQDADLGFQTGVTELLATSPTRCPTLAPCQAACIPAPSSAPSTAFPASTLPQEIVLAIPIAATMTATMTDSSFGIDKGYESRICSESYLGPYSLRVGCAAPRHKAADHAKLSHDAVREADKILQDSNDIRNGRGCRQPKPPWLLCREGSGSWFAEMQLSCQFLLEASPWCSRYVLFVQLRTPWPPPNSGRCCSLGIYFKHKLAPCMLISIMTFLQHGQSKRLKPPWWLLVWVLGHQKQDLFTWLLLRRAGTVIQVVFREKGSKYRSFLSWPHKMLKRFAVCQGALMVNGLRLHQLVQDGNTLQILLIFLPDEIEKHIKSVTVASDVGLLVHQPLTFSLSEIINLDDLVMSASPLRHAAPAVYFLGSFMVLSMQVKLEPWPLSEPVQYSSTPSVPNYKSFQESWRVNVF